MQLDFWQYSQGPVERIVVLIAERAIKDGQRVLVVDGDAERRAATIRALWEASPEAFLANGESGDPHAERQPILLSDTCTSANGARFAILADGKWREGGEAFDRTILLFGQNEVAEARKVWRQFDGREDVTRAYFAQEDGKWVKKV
ncbi:DNA polymerase III subunit chi [Tsuneonella deserti]|uniref:DNA polymerase III subunit chi n=1 Tax=Tsuneonella deserti TaxID=2035528 RepID=A0ABQ1S268_9SPHN|nr:DNA polymerase III subunit chi [Tsuneonella deserti]GGD90772.1 DNA polymerase III subunit chi [Tsuneonella deserti]